MLEKTICQSEEYKCGTPKIRSSIHNINYKQLKQELNDILFAPLIAKIEDPIKSTLQEITPVIVDKVSTEKESNKTVLYDHLKIRKSSSTDFTQITESTASERSYTRRLSKIQNESLGEKMPNFIKNYDGILKAINSNSKKDDYTNTPKKFEETEIDSKNDEFNSKTSTSEKIQELDKLSQLITSTGRKSQTIHINSTQKLDTCVTLHSMTNTEDIKDFYEYTEACMKRIVRLTVVDVKEIEHMMIDLPFEDEMKKKRLAIFDLDETLVHCESRHPHKGQVQIKVNLPDGSTGTVKYFK
jgi:hypothetical protein